MSDAILATFVDSVFYWPPAETVDSTGKDVYEDPQRVQKVRVDDSVSKEIRDLLRDVVVSMTVWSTKELKVGGWLCRIRDFDLAEQSMLQFPQTIKGAKQIVNVGTASSYDKSRVFWRAVG